MNFSPTRRSDLLGVLQVMLRGANTDESMEGRTSMVFQKYCTGGDCQPAGMPVCKSVRWNARSRSSGTIDQPLRRRISKCGRGGRVNRRANLHVDPSRDRPLNAIHGPSRVVGEYASAKDYICADKGGILEEVTRPCNGVCSHNMSGVSSRSCASYVGMSHKRASSQSS